jgi:hypothetical protein
VRDLVRARVAHGREVQHVPEQAAVLAVVAQKRAAVGLSAIARRIFVELLLVAVAALEIGSSGRSSRRGCSPSRARTRD